MWELVLLADKQLLRIPDVAQWWKRSAKQLNATEMPIRSRHIAELQFLPPIHQDPFDRILVAQSRSENLPLITSDVLIASYQVEVLW